MCGILAVTSDNVSNVEFISSCMPLIKHRGPDDDGAYLGENVALGHVRLSILELSEKGKQPMLSSCGRYVMAYNGEIYNHLDLRKQYLSSHTFNGTSDTETIVELFSLMQERMLPELVGMWSLLIWDTVKKKLFISRDRFGQKPLYYTKRNGAWYFSSEIKPLLIKEDNQYDRVMVAEFLTTSNYGHMGDRTFFEDVKHFPPSSWAWHQFESDALETIHYWKLPRIPAKDQRPFDDIAEKELHDCTVNAVLSQTLSDVSLGVTLSGGIDSSIITGILATYYDKNINVFTAQAPGGRYDESAYVQDMLRMYPGMKLFNYNLEQLSIQKVITEYTDIQEEPFGDLSIAAHGQLVKAAAQRGVKVLLGGQGADELFFGYTNMLPVILLRQFKSGNFSDFVSNIKKSDLTYAMVLRVLLITSFPGLEKSLRDKSRAKRRQILGPQFGNIPSHSFFKSINYRSVSDVWNESLYGIHLPHMVHYDDRNTMAYGVEGRMPFLDHRIAECVAAIKPEYYFIDGLRKYPLRKACERYLPESIRSRRDKIGFFTPLVQAIKNDAGWIYDNLEDFIWIEPSVKATLLARLTANDLNINDSLLIWRFLITNFWRQRFNIHS